MSMDEATMRSKVIAVVAEIIEADDASSINGDDRLREDLGMDSLMSLELISTLSEQLKIDIELEDAMDIATVNQACDFVVREYAAQSSGVESATSA